MDSFEEQKDSLEKIAATVQEDRQAAIGAMLRLSLLYRDDALHTDMDKSIHWLEKAASFGSLDALFALGIYWSNNYASLCAAQTEDFQSRVFFYEKATYFLKEVIGFFDEPILNKSKAEGLQKLSPEEYAVLLKDVMKKLPEHVHPYLTQSSSTLAKINEALYFDAADIRASAESSFEEAALFLQMPAQQQQALLEQLSPERAQNMAQALGYCVLINRHIKQGLNELMTWYSFTAQVGDICADPSSKIDAHAALGRMYYNIATTRQGTPNVVAHRDESFALAYSNLVKAAEGGHLMAQIKLGRFYFDNPEHVPNLDAAGKEREGRRWLSLAKKAPDLPPDFPKDLLIPFKIERVEQEDEPQRPSSGKGPSSTPPKAGYC